MKKKYKLKLVVGLAWDDELLEPATNLFWVTLKNELSSQGITLYALNNNINFLKKLQEEPKPDFLLLDVIDKANNDYYGYHLAGTCRANGFNGPIFMISREPTALSNLRQHLKPPYFVFHKNGNIADIAFTIFNFTSYFGLTQSKIFIGHGGKSKQWQKLKRYIENTFTIECEEFNSFAPEGFTITERIAAMKGNAGLAFLVMTAEDEMMDGSQISRPNVVHEIGFFQGFLGFRRVIIFLQDGCKSFSNISGIVYIRFARDISSSYTEIEPILRREKFIH